MLTHRFEKRRDERTSMSLTPQQCRAARAILDRSQDDIALRARIDINASQIFEAGDGIDFS
ncbi:hypothetical protein QTL95_10290 [Rhizobium sp. S152]|uniref:hypothetical protein n=1 Tax=Rhizobium sp. S152 TaxID=3055038 RepID=UPI0025A94792|nr:hypothetical protein [Rhizobium sp. S152]MDM9626287.1 hypothetical protein [Rhizobium sp. S152]